MTYLKPNKNGIVYPINAVSDAMRNWMDQLKGSKSQIGEISHPDRNKELIDELKNFKWEVEFEPIFNNDNSKLDYQFPIGELFYMDFAYDDGQVYLKTNRKRITLQFNWMEEVNHGTYFNR